jgi:Uma2 family endonuclease
MSTATKLLTAEEFWQLPDTENQRSLIKGEVVEEMPVGGEHGIIAIAFGMALRLWAKANHTGVVGGESGFLLARHPDIVRSPDIYFVRTDRIPESGVPRAFWDVAPDLAVEVISPSESAQDILDIVHDYLAAGTSLVWVAYPHAVTVVAHTPDGLARTYRSGDLLTDPDVLPGFSCVVKDLFE